MYSRISGFKQDGSEHARKKKEETSKWALGPIKVKTGIFYKQGLGFRVYRGLGFRVLYKQGLIMSQNQAPFSDSSFRLRKS